LYFDHGAGIFGPIFEHETYNRLAFNELEKRPAAKAPDPSGGRAGRQDPRGARACQILRFSFLEFLRATGNAQFIEPILKSQPLPEFLHDTLMEFVGHYLAIGGMPESVAAWVETKDPRASYEVAKSLVETYRMDFPKYAKKYQLKYLEILFNQIPHFIGDLFKYSSIHGEYKKRELAPCLDLLRRANVVHQITHSAGNGIPLGAEVNLDWFKTIFLDVGLSQSLLGLDLHSESGFGRRAT
jgi:predicted AAA+ superfamily ATPase